MRYIVKIDFLECSKAFSKAIFIGRKWQDKIDKDFLSWGEKNGKSINKLWWHLIEHHCPILWSCLQFFLLGLC